jgi:single-strand DNA-binding protein
VPSDVGAAHVNEVRLIGELAAIEPRTLPSGDELLTFRLTVRRPTAGPGRASRFADDRPARRVATSDALACLAGTARVASSLQRCAVGDLVEAVGRLQRRFCRSAAGPASAYQVEVLALRRLSPRGRATVAAAPNQGGPRRAQSFPR